MSAAEGLAELPPQLSAMRRCNCSTFIWVMSVGSSGKLNTTPTLTSCCPSEGGINSNLKITTYTKKVQSDRSPTPSRGATCHPGIFSHFSWKKRSAWPLNSQWYPGKVRPSIPPHPPPSYHQPHEKVFFHVGVHWLLGPRTYISCLS